MGVQVSKPLEFYAFRPAAHDFYRCYNCHTIITYEQEQIRLNEMTEGKSSICACGSRKYSPTFPVGQEWLLPRVWVYASKLVLARGVAPWVAKYCAWALPIVERLVSNKLTR